MPLSRLIALRKSGTEPLHADGQPVGGTLLGFWRSSASDLVSNATRGILAEYLVRCATSGHETTVRDEWDAFDLMTPDGIRVEVKSCAYLQSWKQTALSKIVFATPKSRAWSADTGQLADEDRRQADVYVFALLHHADKKTVDPLNVRQWTFYVVPTAALNARTRSQHSITLKSLTELCPHATTFEELGSEIARFGRAQAV